MAGSYQLISREEVIRSACRIMSLAYQSIANYERPNDGFCDLCPRGIGHDDKNYRSTEAVHKYVRLAVVEKLKRDGFEIYNGFDPETGEEILDTNPQET